MLGNHRHGSLHAQHAFGSFQGRTREGLTLTDRRGMLKAGLAGVAGLSLPSLLKAQAGGGAKTGKSVILLWMAGGPSHIDTWDPKPDRPYIVTGRLVNDLMPATTDEVTGTVILTNVTIPEMIDALLAQARHHQIFYSFPYDAMLTFDGQVGTFVRWKNKAAAPAKTPPSDTSSVQQP